MLQYKKLIKNFGLITCKKVDIISNTETKFHGIYIFGMMTLKQGSGNGDGEEKNIGNY